LPRRSRKERRGLKEREAAAAEDAQRSGPAFARAIASRAEALARTRWFPPAALAALTLVVWARTFAVPVLGWDDDTYLYRDARLAEPSVANVGRILTEPYFANYHPVTTLTYAFDRAVYDRWAPGFHATQLAFYLVGVLLLYYLFRAILGSGGAAFAAAAIYSVHALHVEPVAWLAQRKDVVCLAFYAGAILAYVRYAKVAGGEGAGRWRFYTASLALAALAMLSKGYAVILPGVFVAYDLCFAERFERRNIWDKLPFVALALAVTAFTLLSQGKDTALVDVRITPLQRYWVLLKIFASYVGRTLLPVRLSAKYIVGGEWLSWWVGAAGLVLAGGAAAGFWLLRRRLPPVAFGIALFVMPLGTVMNAFWTLRIWMTDRYLFFPTVGSALALAGCGVAIWRARASSPGHRGAIAGVATGTVALYAALSVARIGVWTDPVLLWSDTLRKQMSTGGSGPLTAGELHRLVKRTGRKLEIVDTQAYAALGDAYRRAGKVGKADALVGGLTKKADAGETDVDIQLARRAIAAGRHDEAIAILKPMVDGGTWLAPNALQMTGEALAARGDVEGAREAYTRALELYLESGRQGADAVFALANLDYKACRFADAAKGYSIVLEAEPESARARFFLAASLCETGSAKKGYVLYEQVLARAKRDPAGAPSLADIHTMMGKAAQEKLGRPADAVRHFEEVLRLVPDHPERTAIGLVIRQQRALMRRGR
jgi:tetratricopeptide (TPR) repeat protein